MRRTRSIGILVVATVGVAMLIASAGVQARLILNFTPSIPTGLYWIEDRAWEKGDRVAVQPSGSLLITLQRTGVLENGRLLMKRVVAAAGDEVCRSGARVSVNGSDVATARSDANLPAWSGCFRLDVGDVFLLGETVDSFDARYFGVTSAGDIVGPAQLLLAI